MTAISALDLSSLVSPRQYTKAPPLNVLGALREQASVVWVDEPVLDDWPGGNGFWLVLRHKEAGQVLKQARLFSSALGGTQMLDPASQQDLHFVQRMMLNMDPPEHSRFRRLLSASFTSRAVTAVEERIREHARGIVDKLAQDFCRNGQGTCDFAADIAADMPLLTLAEIFGMPAEDRFLMYDWANRVIGFQDPDYATSAAFDPASGSDMASAASALRPKPDDNGVMPDPRTREGMPDLYHYAQLLAEHKRRTPGNDIMSLLLSAMDGEQGISNAEFENLFWLFCVAGNETLRNGIPGGMLALLQHPKQLARLRTEPDLIPGAVDEMLRWWTPVMNFRRTAAQDCELDGQAIKTGDKVVVSFISANRDSAVFANPDTFDIDRTPNPHLAFGYGPHFCLGAQFARCQMESIFSEVLSRLTDFEIAGELSFLRSNFQRGIKRFPIRFSIR